MADPGLRSSSFIQRLLCSLLASPVFQVSAIQRLGLRTAMLTGDCAGAAAAVAAAVALHPADVHASLLPDDKLAKVRLLVGSMQRKPARQCAPAFNLVDAGWSIQW